MMPMLNSKIIFTIHFNLTFVLCVVFSLQNCQSRTVQSSASDNSPEAIQKSIANSTENEKVKFSSVYTKLDLKKCKPNSKPSNDEDEVSYLCNGYKNYKIYVNTHGLANFVIGREISANTDSWSSEQMPTFPLNAGSDQIIEWRLAGGEPFACIVRAVYDRQIYDPDAKGMANELMIKNLKGFAPIDEVVDASKNKDANEEARRRADQNYRPL